MSSVTDHSLVITLTPTMKSSGFTRRPVRGGSFKLVASCFSKARSPRLKFSRIGVRTGVFSAGTSFGKCRM